MSSKLILHILRRESIPLRDIYDQLDPKDAGSKRFCNAIIHVKNAVSSLDQIVDPVVTGIPRSLTLYQLSQANKRYFAIQRNSFLDALNTLVTSFEEYVMVVGGEAPLPVEEAVGLSDGLTKLYSTIKKGVEDLTKLLAQLESSVILEEIVDTTASLRLTWANLKLTINNQIVTSGTFALQEEVREDVLARLAEVITLEGDN